jgi:hypothetical protein
MRGVRARLKIPEDFLTISFINKTGNIMSEEKELSQLLDERGKVIETIGPCQQHHPFGPSVLERRFRCPMSYPVEKNLPDVQTEAGQAGTDFHNQMRSLIETLKNGQGALSQPDNMLFGSHPLPIETMLMRLLDIYAGYDIGAWPDDQIFTEVQLPMPEITGDNETVYGTADCVIVRPDSVVVIDWKTGRGETVDVSDNLQTAAYCVAAARKFGRDSAMAYIVNPNFRHEPGFLFTREMLDGALWQIIEIKKNGEDCERNPDISKYNPGEIQCKHCKGNLHGTCPVVQKAFNQIVLQAEKPDVFKAIALMNDDELSDMKDKCSLVQKLIKAVDDEAKKRCLASVSKSFGKYFLKETSGGKEIENLHDSYSAISGLMTVDEFIGLCSISVPSFREAIAEKLKSSGAVKTKKAGEEQFNVLLMDYLVDKPPRQILTRVKD